jgi:NAD(P)-dependent dehydrogenase (short-subunit alcohol dehydrogenase family)
VTKDDQIKKAVEHITSSHGVLDVLINNAGIGAPADAPDRRSELNATLNMNTVSQLVLAEALIPLLKKSKDPRIVNISSGMGSVFNRMDPKYMGYEFPFEGYRLSKAALNMMSACLYVQNKHWGLKSFAYCPGFVQSNLSGDTDEARQMRIDMGAEPADTSAEGIVQIIKGKRDGEVEKFVTRRGEVYGW